MDREPSEYELALRARDGDRDALSELLERVRLRLFALAYAELGHYEDAQDAVAAAVLQGGICTDEATRSPKAAGCSARARDNAGGMRSDDTETSRECGDH